VWGSIVTHKGITSFIFLICTACRINFQCSFQIICPECRKCFTSRLTDVFARPSRFGFGQPSLKKFISSRLVLIPAPHHIWIKITTKNTPMAIYIGLTTFLALLNSQISASYFAHCASPLFFS